MRHPNRDDVKSLLKPHRPPCISLYQSTHRTVPDVLQDPIRFKNLIERAAELVRGQYPALEAQDHTSRLRQLLDDEAFWKNRWDGLAVFSSPDRFDVFRLHQPVEELVVVGESFHLRPILRSVQSDEHFQVLCLSEREIKLWEGNRYALDEMDLKALNIPRRLSDAMGVELDTPTPTTVSYADAGGPYKRHGDPGVRYGNAARQTEQNIDTQRFFTIVDRAVYESVSASSRIPLVLCGLPRHQALFRAVSHNPHLVETGVEKHPDSLDKHQLRQEAWKSLEPQFQKKLDALVDNYRVAAARGLASDDVAKTAEAISRGRVATLLIEADRCIPGRYDAEQGTIELVDAFRAGVDDVLDDLAEEALRRGAAVVVMPAHQMPTLTGIAASFRF
jgi:hypothetical protein